MQTFKTENVLKIFQLFFLYSVQGARCGNRRKFHVDRRIFKHCKKSAKMSDGFPTRKGLRITTLELANVFLSLVSGFNVPIGTVIVLSSASYLGRV
jgi:hypothetical protein